MSERDDPARPDPVNGNGEGTVTAANADAAAHTAEPGGAGRGDTPQPDPAGFPDPEDAEPVAPGSRPARGFGLALFLAVAVGVGAAGGIVWLWREMNVVAARVGTEGQARQAVEAEIDTLRTRIANLNTRLDGLEAAPTATASSDPAPAITGQPADPAPLRQDLEALAARLDALAATVTAGAGEAGVQLPAAEPATDPRIDTLTERLDQLEQAARGEAPASSADLAALRTQVEATGAELAALRPLADAERRDSAGMRAWLALGTLRRAVEAGGTFSGPLDIVRARVSALPGPATAGADEPFAALAAHAEGGVPTAPALRVAFESVAGRIVAAPVTAEGADTGVGQRMLDGLRGLVSVRRTDETEGDSAAARVNRAERSLAAGDVAGAVAALEGLEGGAAAAAAPWLARARSHLDTRRAIDRLESAVAAALGETP